MPYCFHDFFFANVEAAGLRSIHRVILIPLYSPTWRREILCFYRTLGKRLYITFTQTTSQGCSSLVLKKKPQLLAKLFTLSLQPLSLSDIWQRPSRSDFSDTHRNWNSVAGLNLKPRSTLPTLHRQKRTSNTHHVVRWPRPRQFWDLSPSGTQSIW